MTRDPVVEEVRAARDVIAQRYDYDIEAIFAALREMETRSGRELVRLPPREVSAPVRRTERSTVATDRASRRQ